MAMYRCWSSKAFYATTTLKLTDRSGTVEVASPNLKRLPRNRCACRLSLTLAINVSFKHRHGYKSATYTKFISIRYLQTLALRTSHLVKFIKVQSTSRLEGRRFCDRQTIAEQMCQLWSSCYSSGQLLVLNFDRGSRRPSSAGLSIRLVRRCRAITTVYFANRLKFKHHDSKTGDAPVGIERLLETLVLAANTSMSHSISGVQRSIVLIQGHCSILVVSVR